MIFRTIANLLIINLLGIRIKQRGKRASFTHEKGMFYQVKGHVLPHKTGHIAKPGETCLEKILRGRGNNR